MNYELNIKVSCGFYFLCAALVQVVQMHVHSSYLHRMTALYAIQVLTEALDVEMLGKVGPPLPKSNNKWTEVFTDFFIRRIPCAVSVYFLTFG